MSMESRPNNEIDKERKKCRIDEEVTSPIVWSSLQDKLRKKVLLHFEGENVIPKWFTETCIVVHKISIKQEMARDRRMGSDIKGFKEQLARDL